MKKNILRRCAALLLSAAMLGSCAVQSMAHTRQESEIRYGGEVVDLGTLGTSSPMSMSLENGTVDLKSGRYEKWIDRVDLQEEYLTLYRTLAEATDGDISDPLISMPSLGNESTASPNLKVGDVVRGSGYVGILAKVFDATNTSDLQKQANYAYRSVFTTVEAFDRDYPQVFWLSNQMRGAMSYGYSTSGGVTTYTCYIYLVIYDASSGGSMIRSEYNANSILAGIDQLDRAAQVILDTVPEGAGDGETVRTFDNWLTRHNEYNTTRPLEYAPDLAWESLSALTGSIGNNGPVCEAYSRAMKVLCDRAGIPCVLVDGQGVTGGGSGPHMWNYIKVGDAWYGVDTTWNDPVGNRGGAVSGAENEDYLLVGGRTVINGTTFLNSHQMTNCPSGNVSFTNGPAISDSAYSFDYHTHTWNGGVVTTAPSYTAPGVRTYTCTGCGQTKTETIPALEHNYSSTWSSNADNHWHNCTDAGYEYLKKDVSPHQWDNGTVTVNPGYDSTGTKVVSCTVCGYAKTETIPALEHKYSSAWSNNADFHWRSCTDPGYESLKTDVAPHTWNDGVITVKPGVETEGKKTFACTVCGRTRTEILPPKGYSYSEAWSSDADTHWHGCTDPGYYYLKQDEAPHTWDAGTVISAPGYGTAGKTAFTCTVCGREKTETIPALEHTYSEAWSSNADTHWHGCTDAGYTHLKQDEAPHAWDGGVITAEPEIGKAGEKVFTCTVCAYEKSEEIPALKAPAPVPAKPYKITNVVSGVHVYWKATEGAEKYGLWRSENGKDGTYKWVANPTVPHFTDTKVESGKTYFYKVTNLFEGEHSGRSEAIGVVYTSTPDISSRRNIAAGVELGWDEIPGATGYAIYRKSYSGADAWVRIATIEGNETFTWIDTSVKNSNGGEYRYTIRALGGADMKTLSGCRNTGRTMVRLSSQVLKSAVKADATSIKCTWTTSSRVTGYEVRFMIGDEVFKTFTVGNYKTGVKTFKGLQAGEDYTVQVRTYKKVDGVGSFYSDWSAAKNVSL